MCSSDLDLRSDPAGRHGRPPGRSRRDWYGEDVISGTYRVGIDIYTTLWYDPTGDCVRERVADSDYEDVLVGDATTLEPREVIDEDGCESCHDVIEFHGSGRVGVNYCIMCHTVGAEDSTSYNTGASIDMPNMIHKIHSSDSLENELCLAGYSGKIGRAHV